MAKHTERLDEGYAVSGIVEILNELEEDKAIIRVLRAISQLYDSFYVEECS
jgi:hypothetical protein